MFFVSVGGPRTCWRHAKRPVFPLFWRFGWRKYRKYWCFGRDFIRNCAEHGLFRGAGGESITNTDVFWRDQKLGRTRPFSPQAAVPGLIPGLSNWTKFCFWHMGSSSLETSVPDRLGHRKLRYPRCNRRVAEPTQYWSFWEGVIPGTSAWIDFCFGQMGNVWLETSVPGS